MYYQYLPDRGPFNRDKLWEPIHSGQPAYIVPPIANLTDGPSGLAYYPGTGFGEQLRDQFLICDFRGGPANSGIRSFKLDPDGAFYKLTDDEQLIWNVLATDVAFGADGALYISDWVDGWVGLGKGRVYRLYDPEHTQSAIVQDVSKLLRLDWTKRRTDQLIRDLEDMDRRIRLEAQWELANRGETSGLVGVAKNEQKSRVTRLHAIWGLDQILRTNDSAIDMVLEKLRPLLKDADEYVRAAAAKLAGELDDKAALTSLIAMATDASPRVRYFSIRALGRLVRMMPSEPNNPSLDPCFAAVVKTIESQANSDPAIRHAGAMFLVACGQPSRIERLAVHPSSDVRQAAAVALRRLRSGSVADFMRDKNADVVGEAVRAIHDAPIPIALEKLAKLPTESVEDPAVIHRVLNANFRIGTEESVAVIAEYAARIAAPDEFRIEALDMLAAWAKPSVLDRVTNQYRPLQTRSTKSAADALQPRINGLLKSSEAVREKAIQVAAKLGLKSIVPQLAKRVADTAQSPTARASALTALADLEPVLALKMAHDIPLSPTTSLVPAALEIISRGDRVASIKTFIEATKLRDTDSRQLGWDILRGIDSPAAVEAIEEGALAYIEGTLPGDVRLNVREAAAGKVRAEIADRLTAYDSTIMDSDPLGPWLDLTQGGNAERGKKLFFEKTELSCVRCHKVDRAGGEVGPNLTVIGKEKDARYLLEAICLPNATIAKGYETAVIATEDGDVINGIVRNETDEFVELLLADGSLKRIKQVDVVARKKGNSSMPAEMYKLMTPRQLRDLIAYLSSLKVDPRLEREAAREAE